MIGGDGDDVYFAYDLGDVAVEQPDEGQDIVTAGANFALGDNIETLILTEGAVGAAIGTGNGLSNQIVGNSANSLLTGLAGNDTLQANNGNDTLIGGLDDDLYYVEGAKDKVVENVGEGIDTVLTQVSFVLPGAVEHLVLLFNSAANGTGNALDNSIEGNDVRNLLIGNAGNDTLKGGADADRLVGGVGDDVYYVDAAGDAITEAAAAGRDTVHSSVSYTLAANVEDLYLEGAALAGIGNASKNVLMGNAANNLLDGKAGADTMAGGDGDDTYVVDNAGDLVEETGGGIDTLVTPLAASILDATIENVTLTGTASVNAIGNHLANRLVGNSGNNAFQGYAGDDSMVGGAGRDSLQGDNGADTLDGGAGADNLQGGAGGDTYIIDNPGDVIIQAPGGDSDLDTVIASVSVDLSKEAIPSLDQVFLTGAGAISAIGNSLVNLLKGNGAANRLDGKEGADTLEGNGGNDTYVVGEAGDEVIETLAGAAGGIDLVLSAISFDLSLPDHLQIENLTLTGGPGDDTDATGNALANALTGNAGNNKLDGLGGADKMAGGLGDDTYVVDLKTDTVTEAAKAGTDTVESALSYVLGANLENLLLLPGFGNIDGTGNAANNNLFGNDGNNRLDGKAGADHMLGHGGNDTYVIDNAGDFADETDGGGTDTIVTPFATILGIDFENLTLTGMAAVAGTGNALANTIIGNGGANALSGEDNNDSLAGAAGNDSVTGGSGNDTLDGGTGADGLAGADGDDTYIIDNAKDVVTEAADSGIDTVKSSITLALAANLEHLTLAGAGAISGTGNELANAITGNTAANILSGGLGNDTLDGGKGNDKLAGGDGADTFLRHSLAEGKDTITDFQTGLGHDVLDISDLLTGYTAGHEAEFVQCVTAAGNTTVKVDADGLANGAKFTDVCVLTGVATDLTSLLDDGNLALT
jgi:Ca2+-binding RTX toxin-like protein